MQGLHVVQLFQYQILSCARPFNLARVYFALCRKIAKTADCSPSSDLTGFYKSPKWRDGLHIRSKGHIYFDTALIDFNSRQFKTCLTCNTAPENWHICVNKGLTYLTT